MEWAGPKSPSLPVRPAALMVRPCSGQAPRAFSVPGRRTYSALLPQPRAGDNRAVWMNRPGSAATGRSGAGIGVCLVDLAGPGAVPQTTLTTVLTEPGEPATAAHIMTRSAWHKPVHQPTALILITVRVRPGVAVCDRRMGRAVPPGGSRCRAELPQRVCITGRHWRRRRRRCRWHAGPGCRRPGHTESWCADLHEMRLLARRATGPRRQARR